MDDIAIEAVKQVPSLAVLVFLVVYFMRYLRGRDELMSTISDRCHEVQDKAVAALEENAKVMGGVAEVIRKCNRAKL